jgi:Spy/CpxP family protein refolding chaperone
MTTRIFLAISLLLTCSLSYAQDTTQPAPNSQNAPAQPRPMRGGGMDRDRSDRGEMRGGGMERGGMRGPGEELLPHGMWWKNPEVAARIGLTADQQKRIEDTFLQSRVQFIHMHASLEEQQLMLEPLLNANPVDQARALAQIDKIADTRADLEKANAKMLLSIRGVLSADQWTKLQAQHRGMRHPDGPGGDRGPRSQPKGN